MGSIKESMLHYTMYVDYGSIAVPGLFICHSLRGDRTLAVTAVHQHTVREWKSMQMCAKDAEITALVIIAHFTAITVARVVMVAC